MYKTILVPIDLAHPDLGNEMLGMARKIGGNLCRIAALYVIPDVPGFVANELPTGLLRKQLVQAHAELKAIAEEAGADSEVLTGHTPTKILEYAENIGADLIVIASHRPGLQDYFLGSTAARVVRHADCAVLVHR
jgi:nucleotide-binding universal stress UspA family protein